MEAQKGQINIHSSTNVCSVWHTCDPSVSQASVCSVIRQCISRRRVTESDDGRTTWRVGLLYICLVDVSDGLIYSRLYGKTDWKGRTQSRCARVCRGGQERMSLMKNYSN